MDWSLQRQKRRKTEGLLLLVLCAFLMVAAVIDCCVRIKGPKWTVNNYDGISLVIIQIQATIQTLSIALLALVSSHTADSIFGVSAIDFQFRIAPAFFSQEWLIKGGLILLAVNVFFHMASLYNLVLAVFLVACSVIWISINQIYTVFAGKGAPEQEVEAYLLYTVEKNPSVPQRMKAFTTFCDDWVRNCESQNNAQFHQHQELFGKMLDVLVMAKEEQERTILQQKSAELIHALSASSNPNVRLRAFSFLGFCYERLWKCISDHKEQVPSLQGSVHILNEASGDISELIHDASIEKIEKYLSWDTLIEYAIVCCFWLGYEAGSPAELSSVGDFAAYMGWKLATSPEKADADCGLLKYWSYITGQLPSWTREAGIQALAQIRLKFAIQLIRGGALGILGKNFYRVALRSRRQINHLSDALLVLEIHGYLYYISEWESTDFVPLGLKQACREFIGSEEIRKLFWGALEWVGRPGDGEDRQRIFSSSLINTVTDQMRRYEYFPMEGVAKTMCIDAALEDFFVFCAICLSDEYDFISAIQDIIDEKYAAAFYNRYIQQPAARARLKSFLALTGRDYEDADQTAGRMMERFAIILRQKIHDYALREASAAQADYEKKVDEARVKEYQKTEILDYLRGVLQPLLSDGAEDEPKRRITLLSLRDDTSVKPEEGIRHFYNVLPANFVEWLCLWAKQNGIVEQKRRKADFADDDALMTFLAQDDYPLVLGTDLAYCARDWHNQEQIRQILSEKTYIPEGPYGWALLLKRNSIQLYLHDVEVEIDSCGINSVTFRVDPESGDYEYEILGVSICFTKEELQQYLHDHYKNVRVNLIFSIKKEPGQLGYLLMD